MPARRNLFLPIVLLISELVLFSHAGYAAHEETVYVRSFDGAYVAAQLRIPDGPGPHPAIVFVHGGTGGHKISALKTAANSYVQNHLFAEGYIVFQVDYRRYHIGQEELEDVIAGYRYLAARPEVDPERIGVIGGSHGGAIALMLGTRLTPAAIVSFAGLTDWHARTYDGVQKILPTLREDPDWQERRLHDGRTIPEEIALIESGELDPNKPVRPDVMKEIGIDLAAQWGSDPTPYRHYSPIERVADINCPILYLVGSEDRNVAGGKALIKKLRDLGRTAEYSEHPGMPHAFYWGLRPNEDGSQPEEFYRALKVTVDFMRNHVKHKP